MIRNFILCYDLKNLLFNLLLIYLEYLVKINNTDKADVITDFWSLSLYFRTAI